MYKALYRKWRPLTFDDVISQQHITDTLKKQLKSDRTAHAYLFTGSRGTGKTTCARILAKTLNCPNSKDGNPCLECEICRSADEDTLTDIIEIDAASNNSVNDIRELRDATVYTPELCRYKVYIIDEVHMLSTSAFNALLKIMEEPPEYVKFVLATTEIHKVPATIISRCQRYDFRRIRQNDIASRLLYIAGQENLSLDENAAYLIAKLSDGGMRDAVSLLDQCSVCAESITDEVVSMTAGVANRDFLFDILDCIVSKNVAGALEITSKLYDMSKNLSNLCEELVLQLRNVMLIQASPASADEIISASPDEMERLKKIASATELGTILGWLEQLQNCHERMKHVINKRVEFEMAVIKLCGNISASSGASSAEVAELTEKIRLLENRIKNAPSAPAPAAAVQTQPVREVLTVSGYSSENDPAPNVSVDIKTVTENELTPCDRWDEIMEEFRKINPAVAGSLEGSHASTKGNVICIFTPNRFFIELFKANRDHAVSLSRAIFNVLGQKYRISARCTTSKEETRAMAKKLVDKAINSSIETAVDNT